MSRLTPSPPRRTGLAAVAVALLSTHILLSGAARAGERQDRTAIRWVPMPSAPAAADAQGEGGARNAGAAGDPDARAPRPLMVVIRSDERTRDQRRFDDVVMKLELVLLAAKFFDCTQIQESKAREHPLLEGIRFDPPSIVVFDSTRQKHAVAPGRASARKAYGTMRKIAQLDYKTSMERTLQKARLLLGRFDQVDAALDALRIKEGRMREAQEKGNLGRTRALQREIEAKRAEMDALYEETDRLWNELWQLERR